MTAVCVKSFQFVINKRRICRSLTVLRKSASDHHVVYRWQRRGSRTRDLTRDSGRFPRACSRVPSAMLPTELVDPTGGQTTTTSKRCEVKELWLCLFNIQATSIKLFYLEAYTTLTTAWGYTGIGYPRAPRPRLCSVGLIFDLS